MGVIFGSHRQNPTDLNFKCPTLGMLIVTAIMIKLSDSKHGKLYQDDTVEKSIECTLDKLQKILYDKFFIFLK